MNENKNEFTLWIGILAIIGIFIFFMPDIERLIFGRAKKMDVKIEEKVEQKPTKTKKTKINKKGSTYECTLEKTESFYTQSEVIKYAFDSSGNTLTVDSNTTVRVENVNSYNQMKETYQKTETTFNNLGEEFKNYYVLANSYDNGNRTITINANVKDYKKAVEFIDNYNSNHQDSTISIGLYRNYTEAEINMKSDGYTCKLS